MNRRMEFANWTQEAGCAAVTARGILAGMTIAFQAAARSVLSIGLAMAGQCVLAGCPAQAQLAVVPSGHLSVVVFADRPMKPEQWSGLFAAIQARMATDDDRSAAETRALDANAELLRGDQIRPGMTVSRAITVYLHGDCASTQPEPMGGMRRIDSIPLGWVRQIDGRIEPFLHVDCSAIGAVLANPLRRLGVARRKEVMNGAMAQVILHEWIHIATQSPGHAKSGIEKAVYSADDLLGTRTFSHPASGR